MAWKAVLLLLGLLVPAALAADCTTSLTGERGTEMGTLPARGLEPNTLGPALCGAPGACESSANADRRLPWGGSLLADGGELAAPAPSRLPPPTPLCPTFAVLQAPPAP